MKLKVKQNRLLQIFIRENMTLAESLEIGEKEFLLEVITQIFTF